MTDGNQESLAYGHSQKKLFTLDTLQNIHSSVNIHSSANSINGVLFFVGGKFELQIEIPESYPFNPPKVCMCWSQWYLC